MLQDAFIGKQIITLKIRLENLIFLSCLSLFHFPLGIYPALAEPINFSVEGELDSNPPTDIRPFDTQKHPARTV